jgi:uncharacterized protein YdeI (YjbR/CyaY-like superfamily)
MEPAPPIFFTSPSELREWFARNHESAAELWVGYHKKATGRPTITWPESVDQALCFGWIDGVRKGVDESRYKIRFTPRKRRSIWSAVNIARMGELQREGLVAPAGAAAFARREESRSAIYSYEQGEEATLDETQERELRANSAAWTFFQAQPAGYRKTAVHWVVRAKREETRKKRLATLIEDSANGRRLAQLTRRPPSGGG